MRGCDSIARSHFRGESDAIHRKRLAAGHARFLRRPQQQRIEPPQFFLEQPRSRRMLIALQRIAADQLGQAVGLMRIGGAHRPHFVERDVDAALRELPGGFRARKASADHCDVRFANPILVSAAHQLVDVAFREPALPRDGLHRFHAVDAGADQRATASSGGVSS